MKMFNIAIRLCFVMLAQNETMLNYQTLIYDRELNWWVRRKKRRHRRSERRRASQAKSRLIGERRNLIICVRTAISDIKLTFRWRHMAEREINHENGIFPFQFTPHDSRRERENHHFTFVRNHCLFFYCFLCSYLVCYRRKWKIFTWKMSKKYSM